MACSGYKMIFLSLHGTSKLRETCEEMKKDTLKNSCDFINIYLFWQIEACILYINAQDTFCLKSKAQAVTFL